jgi:hypothetical protein
MSDEKSPVVSAFSELREFFTLRDAETAARALGDEHAAASRALRLAVQRLRAAQCLAQSGQCAESERALREAIVSLSAARERWPAIAPIVGELPTLEPAEEALDDEIDQRRAESLDRALSDASRAVAKIDGVVADKRGRLAARARRNGVVAAALIIAIGGVWRQATSVKLTPRASATFGAQYLPTNATDGYIATNWLLPDGMTGWLEVSFDRRRVSVLELTNVQNLAHYGAAETTVEFYVGDRMLRSMDVSMLSTVNTATPVRVNVPVHDPIDRIRINIRTFHDLGGGLSEVVVR